MLRSRVMSAKSALTHVQWVYSARVYLFGGCSTTLAQLTLDTDIYHICSIALTISGAGGGGVQGRPGCGIAPSMVSARVKSPPPPPLAPDCSSFGPVSMNFEEPEPSHAGSGVSAGPGLLMDLTTSADSSSGGASAARMVCEAMKRSGSYCNAASRLGDYSMRMRDVVITQSLADRECFRTLCRRRCICRVWVASQQGSERSSTHDHARRRHALSTGSRRQPNLTFMGGQGVMCRP